MSNIELKLVRDNITERPGMTIRLCMNDQMFRTMLMSKLVEESKELMLAGTRSEFIEELADLAEVIEAIMDYAQIEASELRAVKTAKKEQKGAFVQRKLATIAKVDV